MIKTKKQMFIVIGAFILTLLLGTTTYAFFNYTRTGSANTIKVGRISFVTRQTETINLTNAFPIDKTTIDTDTNNVDEVVIEIEGDTDYADGIEYLVSSVNSSIYTSNGTLVPISLDIEVDGLGTENDNYFTARDSKNANIYKQLAGDTLVGDQMLLVGFIKKNTTNGQAEGVDGSITIKAYFDKDKILISDTYDGSESDNMGTTNSMAEGKTVITTTEWNALQSSGLSFKVKIEANEGIWVKGSLEEIMKKTTVMDNIASTYVTNSSGIDFSKISGDSDNDNVIDNGKGVYTRAGTENDAYPIMYYRGDVSDNNVVFNNKCWKAVITTDTGGVKLIYNGVYSENNKCDNTGASSQITLNISGTDTNTFSYSGDNLYKSPAYNGYMWGTVYEYANSNWTSGTKFGSSFTWDGTNYTLVDATNTSPDATHHYSCNSSSAIATCTDLRYVYYWSGSTTLDDNTYYIILQNGKGINDAIAEMQTNTTNSNAKDKIETWYASQMNTVTNQLEDTVWCNDRGLGSVNDNGWKVDGDPENVYLYYSTYERLLYGTPSLTCSKNDSFTWKNKAGNQKLQYPVAMLSSDEINLAGGSFANNETNYLNSGDDYWTMSPHSFYYSSAIQLLMYGYGYMNYGNMYSSYGIRPAISLKHGTPIVSGTGTATDPYIIK